MEKTILSKSKQIILVLNKIGNHRFYVPLWLSLRRVFGCWSAWFDRGYGFLASLSASHTLTHSHTHTLLSLVPDLVPQQVVRDWIKYFRREFPAIAFKASTQTQGRKIGWVSCLIGWLFDFSFAFSYAVFLVAILSAHTAPFLRSIRLSRMVSSISCPGRCGTRNTFRFSSPFF